MKPTTSPAREDSSLRIDNLVLPADLPARPRVFLTRKEIDRARARIKEDAEARRIYDRLVAEARELARIIIEPLDESWWEQDKAKPWDQTYPRVFEKTSQEPGRYARAAATLAVAWLLSDDPHFADKAGDLLMALAAYSFEPVHYDVGMNFSGWGWPMLKAYEAMLPRLSPVEREHLDACFSRLGAAVLTNDRYWIEHRIGGGLNNHLAWHKMMLGLLGLFYQRDDLVNYCLNGPRGLIPLLEDGLLDDGLWCESSLHYHFAGIAPMVLFADCQRRAGLQPSLFDLKLANGRTLRQPLDAMFNVLAPDGLIPPIGDAYGARTRLWDVDAYEYAWCATQDPRYAWLLRQSSDRSPLALFSPPLPDDLKPPPIGSMVFPEHGYAFLRSHRDEQYWGTDARCAFLTFDRSGVHANADKLSLMLFGQKQMLLSDIEGRTTTQAHAFSSRIQHELNRGGLSQNTVMIDGADQRYSPKMLRLIEFHDSPDEKRVSAADLEGVLYDGVRQMRTVIMTPNYVLDVFQVDAGDHPRQIDWVIHVMDERAELPGDLNPVFAPARPFELPPTGPWTWLRQARSIMPPPTLDLTWRRETARLRLIMPNNEHERVIFCGYPSSDARDAPSIPMLIVRHHGSNVVFVAVWLVGEQVRDLNIKPAVRREDKLEFQLTANGILRRHDVPNLQRQF